MNRSVLLAASTLAVLLVLPSTTFAALSATQLKKLKAAVSEDFKDPGSAQFRKIELMDGRNAKQPGEGIYCGEVNAKNSYGAYTGFMPFVGAVVGNEALAMKVADDADGAAVVREICQKAKAGAFAQ